MIYLSRTQVKKNFQFQYLLRSIINFVSARIIMQTGVKSVFIIHGDEV